MMLQMREWFRYLKWVLIIIIVMFVWWAFATWGGGANQRATQTPWAATVNGTPISITAFQSYARRLDSTYQSLFGEQYAQQRPFLRIGQVAIGTLVDQELLYQEAGRQGLTVSPAELAQAITREPSLQENGQFIGLERYRRLFQGGRMNVVDYEDQVRRGLMIDKARAVLEDAVTVSDAEVEEEFRRRNEKSTVDYILVDPAALKLDAPDDVAIARHYEDQGDRYSRGEGRAGLYVLFSPAQLSTTETVTDQEIAASYQRDLATRYTVREQRRASHILLKVPADAAPKTVAGIEAKARGILRQVKAGSDFAALAKRHSEDATAQSGGDLNWFGRGQMVKEFDEAAFSLPVGGISDLVRTTYGFHIIKVTDSRPGRTVPLEEVRTQIGEQLKIERARGEMLKRAADFARAAAGGRLEAVAKSQGLAVQDTGTVHAGEALASLAASQPVVARMLGLTPGQVSEPIPTPSGQVVVQVTDTVAAEPKPLAEVRAQVIKDLQDARAREAVAGAVRAARERGGLKALAGRYRTQVKSQVDLARGAALPGVPPAPGLEEQIAALPVGALGDPLPTPAGILVLSVRQRQDHHEEFAAQKDAIRDNLVRQRQDRFTRAILKRLRDQSDVVVNDALVGSLDQG